MLPGGEGAARYAVDKDLDPGLAVGWGQPHMIGRAFIAERSRHGPMNRESIVGEGQL